MKCGGDLGLVHDAYIKWWDKTGHNLFEEKEFIVIQAMRYAVLRDHQDQTHVWKGEKRLKPFIRPFGEPWEEAILSAQPNQEIEYELTRVLAEGAKLKGTLGMVYNYLLRGFKPFEIEEIEGISQSLIGYYHKTIKQRLN